MRRLPSGGHALSGRAGTRSRVRLSPGCSALPLRCLLMSEAHVAGPSPVQCFHQHRISGTSTVHSMEAVSGSPFSSRGDSDCALGRRCGRKRWGITVALSPCPTRTQTPESRKESSGQTVASPGIPSRLLFVFLNRRWSGNVQSETGLGCGRVR